MRFDSDLFADRINDYLTITLKRIYSVAVYLSTVEFLDGF